MFLSNALIQVMLNYTFFCIDLDLTRHSHKLVAIKSYIERPSSTKKRRLLKMFFNLTPNICKTVWGLSSAKTPLLILDRRGRWCTISGLVDLQPMCLLYVILLYPCRFTHTFFHSLWNILCRYSEITFLAIQSIILDGSLQDNKV